MNVEQHIDFAKMQTKLDEAHISFNSEAVYPSVTVEGKPVMIVNGLVQGTQLEWKINTGAMKERVSKLTYPTLQHCLRMLYTVNGNSKH